MDDKPLSTKLPRKLAAIKWRFVFRGVLAFVVATPFLIAIALSPIVDQPLYNRIIFHPKKFLADDYAELPVDGITPAEVYFKSASGVKLHGLLYKLPGAQRIILLSHGNGGNIGHRKHLVSRFLRTGNSLFEYDYAGFGRSEGEPSLEGISEDAFAAYQYLLTQEHYEPKQIILFGESLGTLVTGYLAGSVKCAGVILECPLYSIRRKGCEWFPFLVRYPDWAWTAGARQLDNSVALKKSHAPLLIIAGTADQMTPIQYADELYALAPSPKFLVRIEGGGHGDRVMMTSPEYKLGLQHFLDDLK
jgi:fermentation-respiration switch protein FrsA (DUF1100 family)